MFLAEELQKKWGPVLEHPELPSIKDSYRKQVTAILLENQEHSMRQSNVGSSLLTEASPANVTAGVDKFDPVLISLVRRAMPQLIAYDICGVQPMTGPTGLIFAMKSKYTSQAGTEALFDEADTSFSGTGTHQASSNLPSAQTGTGVATATAEALGGRDISGSIGSNFNEMAFSIDKVTVTAKSRALKGEYSMELAQDLKAIHGLDAETELANILSAEILAEINREVVRSVYLDATAGASVGTASAGTFDLDVDSNGRWSVEKFKGLMFQIEREANAIAKTTRRGKGNLLITSSDVASALQMAGILDYTPALNNSLNTDETQTTFAGVLNGRYKVYVDPYAPTAANQYFVVGYKGASAYDAGIFYCPYVPLQMVRAIGEDNFQPRIGFKTRYGMVANPFAYASPADSLALGGTNKYYRKVTVTNLM